MNARWQSAGFGLYIHWPFCAAKCPYCDFNSHVTGRIAHDSWRRALLTELARVGQETPGRVLHSIFFGGGTPSLMEPQTVQALISEARRIWRPANDLEITLEANPGSVDAARFAAFRAAGVNRVSIGIQALNDTDLRRLGRLHSADEARRAFDIARKTFDRVSFDLIYARQAQSLRAWRAELAEALAMGADHLSLYQLTIEPGTAFGERWARGTLHDLPGEALGADLFGLTQEMCEAAGYPRYEVSNHARAGEESRHNLIYWNCGDYVGIGPGAHGRLTTPTGRWTTQCHADPARWMRSALAGSAELPRERLNQDEQADEYLVMGLRKRAGVRLSSYAEMAGRALNPAQIQAMAELGMVELAHDRLWATERGTLVLNQVIAALSD